MIQQNNPLKLSHSCELVLKDMQKELSPPKMSLASNIVGFNMGLQRLVAESRVKLAERSETAEVVTQAAADVDKAVERLRLQNKVAVSGVVLTALVELNKRSLMMESAAKSRWTLTRIFQFVDSSNIHQKFSHLEF